ncbi:MAG: type II toxin-antitoxin system death-on-curing family toxin [Holosporales bacterium]|jgi:death-on-curing protein
MSTWIWLDIEAVCAAHDAQIMEHGGLHGIRDRGLLEAGLARPQHLAAYEEPDAIRLAAAYAVGIARNHPFLDANKRTAVIAMEMFLTLNGYKLLYDDAACFPVVLQLATGEMSETDLAAWLAAGCAPTDGESH